MARVLPDRSHGRYHRRCHARAAGNNSTYSTRINYYMKYSSVDRLNFLDTSVCVFALFKTEIFFLVWLPRERGEENETANKLMEKNL